MTRKKLDIRPQAVNANQHTQRGMGMLEGSIERDGWIGAITVAADGETFDGSARVEVTARMDMLDDPIVVETDGTRPVVVKRVDIPTADDPRARRLGIAANRVAELNLAWDPGVLAEMRDDPEVALGALFTPDEMADLAQPAEPPAPGDDASVAVDETQPTRCQPGEVWRVGRHTVACVDSTDRATVARLIAGRKVGMVVADPPYGIDIVDRKAGTVGGDKPFGGYAFRGIAAKGKTIPAGRYAPIANDDSTDTAERAVSLALDILPKAIHFWWGANNYANVLPPSTCWIVWDKETTGHFADAELASIGSIRNTAR